MRRTNTTVSYEVNLAHKNIIGARLSSESLQKIKQNLNQSYVPPSDSRTFLHYSSLLA